MTRVLVWQWGRFGAGPRLGVDFAAGFAAIPGIVALLSLSRQAEIMQGPHAPECALPVDTYRGVAGLIGRAVTAPLSLAALARRIEALRPDMALCAMPGPLDLLMHAALRMNGVPYAVIVHDAEAHPGDGYPFQMELQRALMRRAGAVVTLSAHVENRLRARHHFGSTPILRAMLPAPALPRLPPPRAHGGPFRLLSFGRLLPYKGLDLFADALRRVLPDPCLTVRVVGQGPESPPLAELAAMPGVQVENRWVPEAEIPELVAWADALVLSHREASQSGIAALALAGGRILVATRVGGLIEQAAEYPGAVLAEPTAGALADAIRLACQLPAPDPAPVTGQGAALLTSLRAALRR